jgi:hypothetical protein
MKRYSFGVAWLFLGLLPASVRASVVLSENFNELTPHLAVTSVGSFSAIDGTNVDIVGDLNGSVYPALCVAPESGNCIDLDGTGGHSQGILRTKSTIPAGTYHLSFDLIGSQRDRTTSTTVTFGPYSQTFVLNAGDVSNGIVSNVPVTLSSPAYLTFTSNTPGVVGALLDNVLVTSAAPPAATPAPPTLWLMIAGCMALLAYALWHRRRLA